MTKMLSEADIKVLADTDYCVVFARFNENLEWVDQAILNGRLQKGKLVVMNKGDMTQLSSDLQSRAVAVENLGLDQYCHLRYIVENYNSLPEIIIFAQAGMNEHHDVFEPYFTGQSVKILNTMNQFNATLDTVDILLGMVKQALLYGKTLNAKTYVGSDSILCAYDSLKIDSDLEDISTGMTFGEWFTANVKSPFPGNSNLVWFKNAIFGTSKKYIMSRPKSYYESILQQITTHRGEILHFIERSWYYMLHMDMNLEPFGLLNTLDNNKHIFEMLDNIIVHSGQSYVEGSLFFRGMQDTQYNVHFLHKQLNLFNLAKGASRILEIGFNTGHSCALMLLANPNSKALLFDIKEHAYVQPCLDFLKSVFGADRFIDFVEGDSRINLAEYLQQHPELANSFDLLHVDGGHQDLTVMSDLKHCILYSNKENHTLVINDYDHPNINTIVRQLTNRGILHKSTLLQETLCGDSFHYICRYT